MTYIKSILLFSMQSTIDKLTLYKIHPSIDSSKTESVFIISAWNTSKQLYESSVEFVITSILETRLCPVVLHLLFCYIP